MSGITCEPRQSPATKWPRRYGSTASSGAGKIPWVRTTATGSSLPVYVPAMLWSRVALTATICSSGLWPGMDRFDREAVGVLEQRRDVPHTLRDLETDQAVPILVIHVDDGERESLVQLRIEEQPAVVHRIAEHRVERVVERARAALVRGEHQDRLRGPVLAPRIALECDLRHAGSGAADVAGGCIDQEILSRAVQPLLLRNLGARDEAAPGELVDRLGARAVRVGHDERDVVSGVRDHGVDEELAGSGARRPEPLAKRRDRRLRRPGVAADGADVGFDDREGDLHRCSSSRRHERRAVHASAGPPAPRRPAIRQAPCRIILKATAMSRLPPSRWSRSPRSSKRCGARPCPDSDLGGSTRSVGGTLRRQLRTWLAAGAAHVVGAGAVQADDKQKTRAAAPEQAGEKAASKEISGRVVQAGPSKLFV